MIGLQRIAKGILVKAATAVSKRCVKPSHHAGPRAGVRHGAATDASVVTAMMSGDSLPVSESESKEVTAVDGARKTGKTSEKHIIDGFLDQFTDFGLSVSNLLTGLNHAYAPNVPHNACGLPCSPLPQYGGVMFNHAYDTGASTFNNMFLCSSVGGYRGEGAFNPSMNGGQSSNSSIMNGSFGMGALGMGALGMGAGIFPFLGGFGGCDNNQTQNGTI
jgi:hypothetical protein